MTLSLVDKQLEIDQKVIDYLEDALALAREGKIRDLVLGYTQTDLEFFTVTTFKNWLTALGLAEALKHDVLHIGDVQEGEQ